MDENTVAKLLLLVLAFAAVALIATLVFAWRRGDFSVARHDTPTAQVRPTVSSPPTMAAATPRPTTQLVPTHAPSATANLAPTAAATALPPTNAPAAAPTVAEPTLGPYIKDPQLGTGNAAATGDSPYRCPQVVASYDIQQGGDERTVTVKLVSTEVVSLTYGFGFFTGGPDAIGDGQSGGEFLLETGQSWSHTLIPYAYDAGGGVTLKNACGGEWNLVWFPKNPPYPTLYGTGKHFFEYFDKPGCARAQVWFEKRDNGARLYSRNTGVSEVSSYDHNPDDYASSTFSGEKLLNDGQYLEWSTQAGHMLEYSLQSACGSSVRITWFPKN